jgi:hypothetical protein
MSNQLHPANPAPNGGYERSDIGTRGVLYFLAGLAVAGLLASFVVAGLYSYLNKRSEAEQAPVNPLVTNAPADTRRTADDYPKSAFPNPRLETDERTQLDDDRLQEEQTLSTYDYIDKQTDTVRIPIDRAMDLIAQRGLPVRSQTTTGKSSSDLAFVSGRNTYPVSTDPKVNKAATGKTGIAPKKAKK